jgi:hypothetical protein
MSEKQSPFNWNTGKPSIFAPLRAFNGIDAMTAEKASRTAKQTILLKGSIAPVKPKSSK